MRQNAFTVQGVHGVTKQSGRMDPAPHSGQATATPGGPGRSLQAGSEETIRSQRATGRPDVTRFFY